LLLSRDAAAPEATAKLRKEVAFPMMARFLLHQSWIGACRLTWVDVRGVCIASGIAFAV
jgi:hypothetical protein